MRCGAILWAVALSCLVLWLLVDEFKLAADLAADPPPLAGVHMRETLQNSARADPGPPSLSPAAAAAPVHVSAAPASSLPSVFGRDGKGVPLPAASARPPASTAQPPPPPRSYLDVSSYGRLHNECQYLFLDIGSNIGVQIRKLYEPGPYMRGDTHEWRTMIQSTYQKHFPSEGEGEAIPWGWSGPRNRETCVIAFEPNPNHAVRLERLAQYYVGRGHGVVVRRGI